MEPDTPETRADAMPSIPGLAWTSTAIAVAVVFLGLFNAASPKAWIAQQAPDAVPAVVRDLVEGWWSLAEATGLNAPRTAVADLWKQAQAVRWPPPAAGPRDQR